jgi:sulfur carrier protein
MRKIDPCTPASRRRHPKAPSMQIIVNGQERTVDAPVTVAALLDALGMTGRRVAVEVNREIVPRSRHGECALKDHDRVEVVFAIGGG